MQAKLKQNIFAKSFIKIILLYKAYGQINIHISHILNKIVWQGIF